MTIKPRFSLVENDHLEPGRDRRAISVTGLFKPLWVNFLNDPDLFPDPPRDLDDSVDRMDQALVLFNARRAADDNWCLEFDTQEDMMTFIIRFS